MTAPSPEFERLLEKAAHAHLNAEEAYMDWVRKKQVAADALDAALIAGLDGQFGERWAEAVAKVRAHREACRAL